MALVGLAIRTVVVAALTAPLVAIGAPAHAAAPSNDEAGSATVIPSLPFNDFVDTTEATASPETDSCGEFTVWYKFTAAEDAHIEFDTDGSSFER